MSRRTTVSLNLECIKAKIKQSCRSNIVFCERMGKHPRWVSEWSRIDSAGNPTPKNLPSPEEAARMCAILQAEPEDILTDPADIELVRGLLDTQREAQKKPAPISESELSEAKREAWELLKSLDDDSLKKFIKAVKALQGE